MRRRRLRRTLGIARRVGLVGSVRAVEQTPELAHLVQAIPLAPAPARIAPISSPRIAAGNSPTAANPKLAAKGVWNPSTDYLKDDIVTARGSTWIAKRNNKGKVPGQTSPSTDWQLSARGFNPTGAWSNATKYQPDDLVTHNGQTWRAKITVPANRQPAANQFWELLAHKGAQGDVGPQGPAGQGARRRRPLGRGPGLCAPLLGFCQEQDRSGRR